MPDVVMWSTFSQSCVSEYNSENMFISEIRNDRDTKMTGGKSRQNCALVDPCKILQGSWAKPTNSDIGRLKVKKHSRKHKAFGYRQEA